jgi:hypothetical protein
MPTICIARMSRVWPRVLLAFILIVPSYADAQELGGFVDSPGRISRAISSSANQFPSRPIHHCCNAKGAIIGAAAGAAAGWWIVRSACDSSTCTREYVKYIAVLGGVGATLGVFADNRQRVGGRYPDRRVRINGLITPRVRAGAVSVSF